MATITYSKDALKSLRRMPSNVATLIVSKIERYAADPASLANMVEVYKSEPGTLRLRVGDWRVILSAAGDVIAVLKIGPRGGVNG